MLTVFPTRRIVLGGHALVGEPGSRRRTCCGLRPCWWPLSPVPAAPSRRGTAAAPRSASRARSPGTPCRSGFARVRRQSAHQRHRRHLHREEPEYPSRSSPRSHDTPGDMRHGPHPDRTHHPGPTTRVRSSPPPEPSFRGGPRHPHTPGRIGIRFAVTRENLFQGAASLFFPRSTQWPEISAEDPRNLSSRRYVGRRQSGGMRNRPCEHGPKRTRPST